MRLGSRERAPIFAHPLDWFGEVLSTLACSLLEVLLTSVEYSDIKQ